MKRKKSHWLVTRPYADGKEFKREDEICHEYFQADYAPLFEVKRSLHEIAFEIDGMSTREAVETLKKLYEKVNSGKSGERIFCRLPLEYDPSIPGDILYERDDRIGRIQGEKS